MLYLVFKGIKVLKVVKGNATPNTKGRITMLTIMSFF